MRGDTDCRELIGQCYVLRQRCCDDIIVPVGFEADHLVSNQIYSALHRGVVLVAGQSRRMSMTVAVRPTTAVFAGSIGVDSTSSTC